MNKAWNNMRVFKVTIIFHVLKSEEGGPKRTNYHEDRTRSSVSPR